MAARDPLLLIPGLLCDEALWAHQTEFLSDVADISIADMTRDDSIAAMASRSLAHAPKRFALAGLSMGGYVALEIMRRAPDRVTRLALLDTSARADTPEQTARRRDLIELAEKGRFKGVTPRLLPSLIHPDRQGEQALTDAVMGMAERVGQAAFLRQQNAIMGRPEGRPDLPAIAVPAMVLCGRQDALTPLAVHEEMAAAIPGARMCLVEECGHLSPLERPHAVTALMRDWLLRG